MYRNCPEHPDIECASRTGYPRSWDELYERHLMGHCYEVDDICEDDDDGEEEDYDDVLS